MIAAVVMVLRVARDWAGRDDYFLDVMRAMVFLWGREETHFDVFGRINSSSKWESLWKVLQVDSRK